jgi:hypothetical protein
MNSVPWWGQLIIAVVVVVVLIWVLKQVNII